MLHINHDNPILELNGQTIVFTKTERGFVYAEVGKAAKVYRVKIDGKSFALKDFFDAYHDTPLVKNTPIIRQFKDITGLMVADRTLFTAGKFPELENANVMLMPWVKGNIWFSYVDEVLPMSKTQCLRLAKSLAGVLKNFEKKGIAHCDISSKNVLFSKDNNHVELVDIEEMYAPDLSPPPADFFPAGTPGYVPEWVSTHGAWSENADRYAGGIILAEILAWHSQAVRQNNSEDDSYFSVNEVGKERSERFQMVQRVLAEYNQELPELFEETWFSNSLQKCPPISEWYRNIHLFQENESPKLEVSPTFLDFGKVNLASQTPVIKIKISNSGGGILEGTIIFDDWISVTPSVFKLHSSDDQAIFQVSLKKNIPRHIRGKPYLFPRGIIIDSNGGTCVIGGSFTLPRKTLW